MTLRILLSIALWVAYTLLVFLPLFLIGLILVPLAVLCGAYHSEIDQVKEDKGEYPVVYHFTWPFMWLWDNYEDGIMNQTYFYSPNHLIQAMYWYLRNPVNNLRIVPYLSADLYPDKINFWGSVDGLVLFKPAPVSDDLFEQPLIRLMDEFDTKKPQWWFAWQGVYSNFFWQFKMPFTLKVPFTKLGYNKGDLMRFWIGWKIYPTDIYGITEYRMRGAGFALQFKVVARENE